MLICNNNSLSKALNFHDVTLNNEINGALYTHKEKIYTNRFKAIVESFFPNSRIYKNYRKNFIAIKVENVKDDVNTAEYINFYTLCKSKNITSVLTSNNSLIFRVDAAKIIEQLNGIINK
jgi:hypothetical protein